MMDESGRVSYRSHSQRASMHVQEGHMLCSMSGQGFGASTRSNMLGSKTALGPGQDSCLAQHEDADQPESKESGIWSSVPVERAVHLEIMSGPAARL